LVPVYSRTAGYSIENPRNPGATGRPTAVRPTCTATGLGAVVVGVVIAGVVDVGVVAVGDVVVGVVVADGDAAALTAPADPTPIAAAASMATVKDVGIRRTRTGLSQTWLTSS
jgi:hypothetical protein